MTCDTPSNECVLRARSTHTLSYFDSFSCKQYSARPRLRLSAADARSMYITSTCTVSESQVTHTALTDTRSTLRPPPGPPNATDRSRARIGSSPRPPLRTSPTAPAGARGVGPLEGQDRSQTRRPSRKRATQRAKEEAVNEAHRVEHGSVRMRERLGQWPGAGSTRNGRRKRATLGATHLLLAIKDRCHARGGAPRAPTAKMAKPSLTPATTPVSMRKVK